MKMIFNFSIYLVLSTLPMTAIAQDGCDPKLEAKAVAQAKACDAQSLKSKKVWGDLASAKSSVEAAISKNGFHTLVPYIGCDAGDLSRLETICEADLAKIDEKNLKMALSRAKGTSTLKNSKWVTYGLHKDIFLLCSADYGFKAAKNSCPESETYQPVIEIRKSKAGFYVFGVPLSGI